MTVLQAAKRRTKSLIRIQEPAFRKRAVRPATDGVTGNLNLRRVFRPRAAGGRQKGWV